MENKIEKAVSRATVERKQRALRWFFNATKLHADRIDHFALNVQKNNKVFIGGLFHFLYDAKYADELPYWDKLPLVIPIEIYTGDSAGFLGLNLHYLPNRLRVKLLDVLSSNLEKSLNKGKYVERKYLAINYQILKGIANSDLYSPCIKRYLANHVKSTFIKVSRENWEDVALLPSAKWQKTTQSFVNKQVKYKSK